MERRDQKTGGGNLKKCLRKNQGRRGTREGTGEKERREEERWPPA